MVAPDNDIHARREVLRFGGVAIPAQPGAALLEDRRLSLALRSLAALFFGMGFLWPGLPEASFARLFAAYVLVDGCLALVPGGWAPLRRLGWPLMIGGCVDIAAAVATYLGLWLGLTLDLLAAIVMVWAIAESAAFAAAAVTLRGWDRDHLFLASAIAGLVLGRALLSQLATDPIVLSTWTGLFAMTMATLFVKIAVKHYRVILL